MAEESVTTLSEAPIARSKRNLKLAIVGLYREHPELWQSDNPAYHDRDKRESAYVAISSAVGMERKHLVKVLNALRTQFNKEHRSVLEHLPSGSGAGGGKTEWWLYKELLFLADNIRGRQTQTNVPTVQVGETENIEMAESESAVTSDIHDLPESAAAASVSQQSCRGSVARYTASESTTFGSQLTDVDDYTVPKSSSSRRGSKKRPWNVNETDDQLLLVAKELVNEARLSKEPQQFTDSDEDVQFARMIVAELKLRQPSRKRELKRQLTQLLFGPDDNGSINRTVAHSASDETSFSSSSFLNLCERY